MHVPWPCNVEKVHAVVAKHISKSKVKKKRVVRSTFGRSDVVLREKGCILERQVFRFAEMILRDRCCTSYGLASVSWQAQYFRQAEWKNRKTHWYEAISSALNFPFLNCGSLAELLRFQAYS